MADASKPRPPALAFLVILGLAIALAPPSRGQGIGRHRVDRIGLFYRFQPYQGHQGALLTKPPAEGSPLLDLCRDDGSPTPLEPGDMIVSLDDRVIDGPEELERHVGETKVVFLAGKTGRTEVAWGDFPEDPGNRADIAGESRRVKSLLVIDTASGLPGLDGDLATIRRLLKPLANRCDVAVLKGDDATAVGVLKAVRALGDASSDTVFVYYSGHGATDLGRGHALTFARGGALLRSSLREALASLRPRLAVILTDCCSNLVPAVPLGGGPPMAAGEAEEAESTKIMRSLLLRTRGVVDITSSSFDIAERLNESSMALPEGGLFTAAFAELVSFGAFKTLDRNRDGLLTWGEFFPVLRKLADDRYSSLRWSVAVAAVNPPPPGIRAPSRASLDAILGQPSQTPQAFTLDGPTFVDYRGAPFNPGVRLAEQKMVDPKAGREVVGARLDWVTDESGMFAKALKAGDVITALNGLPFPSIRLMYERLDTLSELNLLRVWRPDEGKFLDIRLPPSPVRRSVLPGEPQGGESEVEPQDPPA